MYLAVTCKSDEAFEDQLTTGADYDVLSVEGGSYLIKNDNGIVRWYGNIHFKLLGV